MSKKNNENILGNVEIIDIDSESVEETQENINMAEKKSSKKGTKGKTPIQKVLKFLKSRLLGVVLSVVFLITTVVLLSEVLYLNALPVKFFIPIAFVLLLIVGVTFLLSYTKKLKTLGKILSLVFTSILCVGIYYIAHASGMLDNISGAKTKTDIIHIYVMKGDSADSLNDASDYTFGKLALLDKENTDKTVKHIKEKIGKEPICKEYEHWSHMVDALYNGEVQAIILNSAYVESMIEMEQYANFKDITKVLHENTIVTEIIVDTDKDVANNTFVMYISGIDVRGKISTTSRSDVNILVVVNPDTRQILMINTPRDYYVPLAMDGGPMDKLTHAGIYGIDISMDTLGKLYGINVDYYFRVNFTGFEKVIDALGGIEVYSGDEFVTTHGNYYIVQGMNNLNGKEALGFVRERYQLSDGDNQRGKNQMAVIKAIIDKMTSTALLNDFSGLMESLEGSFQISMESDQIMSLVRKQLDEGGSWNIVNYAVTGQNAFRNVYSMADMCYVMIPDENTVSKAKELIQKIYDGKHVSDIE